ncbi:hypothetical protein MMC18_007528 [Xylographa bjoerkii]|nr:hypothetical protein [Xylographa bjoerkii]
MKTSTHFNEALFHDPDPTTDQLFEKRLPYLFEIDLKTPCIRLHIQLTLKNVRWELDSSEDSGHFENPAPKECTIRTGCSFDRLTYEPSPPPPQYVENPGLNFREICDPAGLHEAQWHSYSRLRLTPELFEALMLDFNIFPRFREFVLLFGGKTGENEIAPPQMRFRMLGDDHSDPIDSFCTGFECVYGLRYVELNGRKDTIEPWSIRQTVVYNKYIMEQQSSTWVFIAASETAERRMDKYVKSVDKVEDSNPFEIHLILLDTALASWRPYLIYLTVKAADMSDLVLVADIEDTGQGLPLEVKTRQQLKDLEDQIIDVLLILDSTHDTVVAFIDKYEQFCHIANNSFIDIDESLDSIKLALHEKQREVKLLTRKMKAMHKKVEGATSLLSNLLDLATGHSLKTLAEEARKENITMRTLTEKTTHDAAAVKVLTIITLIYLPATVVSSFFSTQFVSQEQKNGSSSLILASNAWLFAAIALPLTAITEMDTNTNRGHNDTTNEGHLSPNSTLRSRAPSHLDLEHEDSNSNSRNPLPEIVVPLEGGQTTPEQTSMIRPLPFHASEGSPYARETFMDSESSKMHIEAKPESPGRLPHNDVVFPHEVSYTLKVKHEKDFLQGSNVVRSVPINGGYNLVDEIAEQQVKSVEPHILDYKKLFIRHGSCKITTKYGSKQVYELTSNDHWKKVCMNLLKYWQEGTVEAFHLDISREYFALQTRVRGGSSFARIKRNEIVGLMKQSLDGGKYIPRTDLERVTSIDTIRQTITEDESLRLSQTEREDFVLVVFAKARTLWAICIYSSVQMKCLKAFVDRGVYDARLPLDAKTQICHERECAGDFDDLLTKQGSFLAPVFREIGEQITLQSGRALPMQYFPIDEDKQATAIDHGSGSRSTSNLSEQDTNPTRTKAFCGSGSFSNVYRVRVDLDHHVFSKNKDHEFAIKEFHDRPGRVSDDFHKEVEVLEELRPYTLERHIVTHYVSWTQDGKYYMLLPYADSNLSEYMKRQAFGPINKANILWLLRQFHGLVDAIESVHTITEEHGRTASSGLSPAQQRVRKSGWHHDIKLENILCFPEKFSTRVNMYLSDFGSGRVQFLRSGSANTRTPSGTQTYEAPDGTVNGGAISRPYDVWSMGCVVLEVLVWASFGYPAVKQFREHRQASRFPGSSEDKGDDDCFWQKDTSGRIYLRPSVEAIMQRLEDEFKHQDRHPFVNIMHILPKMLDVNPTTRIKASDLLVYISQIQNQADIDLKDIADDALPGPKKHPGVSIRLPPRAAHHHPPAF